MRSWAALSRAGLVSKISAAPCVRGRAQPCPVPGKVGGAPMPEYDAPMKQLHRLLGSDALSFVAILMFMMMGLLQLSIWPAIIVRNRPC